jgi:hypothetical protein
MAILETILAAVASAAVGSALGGGGSTAPTPVPNGEKPSPFGDIITSSMGSFAQSGIDSFSQQMFGVRNARNMGRQQKAFFDEFAPGTTQWERIGATSPGMAQVQSTKDTNKTALQVAKIQANTAKEVAKIQSQPASRQATVSEAKLKNELSKLDAETRNQAAQTVKNMEEAILTGQKTVYQREMNKLAQQLLKADLNAKQYKSVLTVIGELLGDPEKLNYLSNELQQGLSTDWWNSDKAFWNKKEGDKKIKGISVEFPNAKQ